MSDDEFDMPPEAVFDKDLFDLMCEVVVQPKKKTDVFSDNSFILHAPLELCARYYLLPLVDIKNREAARERMREVGRRYSEYENDAPRETSRQRDMEFWARSFTSAGHGPILLALSEMIGETNDSILDVLDMMDAAIMNPDAPSIPVVTSTPGVVAERSSIASFFIDNVANARHPELSEGSHMDTILDTVSTPVQAGVIDPVITAWRTLDFSADDIKHYFFPVLARISALSMVVENEEHSKYGWSHALTIPHSHWVLAGTHGHESTFFETALTYVASYRSMAGKTVITSDDFTQYFDVDEESIFTAHHEEILDIISQACTHVDAHLVKYVYTCFDCMKRDPQYSKLYIAAALRLLTIWQKE